MGLLMKRPHGTCNDAGYGDDDDVVVVDDDAANLLAGGYTNYMWPRCGRHPPLAPLPP